MEKKTILITQARLGSTRLPKKIFLEINEKSLLEIHLERLKKCKNISQIVIATTENLEDEIILQKSILWGYNVYRGSESDVLDRFYRAAKEFSADWIVRVTSDCPLIDPELVDQVISFTHKNDIDYGSNTLIENFPDGQDIEVFKYSALEKAWNLAKLSSEREHVTPFIRKHSSFHNDNMFTSLNYTCEGCFNNIRMTVDEKKDVNTIETLVYELGLDASWKDYTQFIINNPQRFNNQDIVRNEGLLNSLKKD